MPDQASSSIYIQFIDGESRVHNGNTYNKSTTEHDILQQGERLTRSLDNHIFQREKHLYQERQERHKLLFNSLAFDRIYSRQQNLREPSPNTCKWILDTKEYQAWIDPSESHEHHGFFWIKGKPGVGKSIIMNYLLTASIDTMPGARPISFFFNARGGELERSISGLYRSLVLQIMTIFPQCQRHLHRSQLHGSRIYPTAWLANTKPQKSVVTSYWQDRDSQTCFLY